MITTYKLFFTVAVYLTVLPSQAIELMRRPKIRPIEAQHNGLRKNMKTLAKKYTIVQRLRKKNQTHSLEFEYILQRIDNQLIILSEQERRTTVKLLLENPRLDPSNSNNPAWLINTYLTTKAYRWQQIYALDEERLKQYGIAFEATFPAGLNAKGEFTLFGGDRYHVTQPTPGQCRLTPFTYSMGASRTELINDDLVQYIYTPSDVKKVFTEQCNLICAEKHNQIIENRTFISLNKLTSCQADEDAYVMDRWFIGKLVVRAATEGGAWCLAQEADSQRFYLLSIKDKTHSGYLLPITTESPDAWLIHPQATQIAYSLSVRANRITMLQLDPLKKAFRHTEIITGIKPLAYSSTGLVYATLHAIHHYTFSSKKSNMLYAHDYYGINNGACTFQPQNGAPTWMTWSRTDDNIVITTTANQKTCKSQIPVPRDPSYQSSLGLINSTLIWKALLFNAESNQLLCITTQPHEKLGKQCAYRLLKYRPDTALTFDQALQCAGLLYLLPKKEGTPLLDTSHKRKLADVLE